MSIWIDRSCDRGLGFARACSPVPVLWAAGLCLCLAGGANAGGSPEGDLTALSLEQLADLTITSVSRRPEPLFGAAASIHVITAADIRRSGAERLSEVLALAPNLYVGRLPNSLDDAVLARGANRDHSNKLLVLEDGRVLYSPLDAGVIWVMQDIVLEDVDRIEVVSGPGGTMWGTNAVNGVINIITRKAGQTQGSLLVASAREGGHGLTLRHGGALPGSGHYRVYARELLYTASDLSIRTRAERAAMKHTSAGMRMDWDLGADTLSLLGAAFRERLGPKLPADRSEGKGFHLLGRWQHRLSGGDAWSVQAYYDRLERQAVTAGGDRAGWRVGSADLSAQHDVRLAGTVRLNWGAGVRRTADAFTNDSTILFLPAARTLSWSHLYGQIDYALQPSVTLTGGLRLERNPYTGLDYLPTLRLAWKESPQRLWWAALSRAVRSPSRVDRDLHVFPQDPPQPPYFVAGGPDFRSEVVNSLDLGLRGQFRFEWSYAVTAYLQRLTHWIATRRIDDPRYSEPYIVIANDARAQLRGLEAWTAWQVHPDWRLSAAVTVLSTSEALCSAQSGVCEARARTTNDAKTRITLRSAWTPRGGGDLDLALRHVGRLPTSGTPASTVMDLRLGWKLTPQSELSLAVRNLFDKRHAEYGGEGQDSRYGREATFKLVWRP